MLIIPEIEHVVILPPKTASTSLKAAVMARYPLAFAPYRHMEADGVPTGYQNWAKVGLVRKPFERLWSLYRYCRDLKEDAPGWDRDRVREVNYPTQMLFEDWIHFNRSVFATSGRLGDKKRPYYHTLYPEAENRKSQYIYLRPDLGTHVFRMNQMDRLCERLGIDPLPVLNKSTEEPMPGISVRPHMLDIHLWDAQAAGGWGTGLEGAEG